MKSYKVTMFIDSDDVEGEEDARELAQAIKQLISENSYGQLTVKAISMERVAGGRKQNENRR